MIKRKSILLKYIYRHHAGSSDRTAEDDGNARTLRSPSVLPVKPPVLVFRGGMSKRFPPAAEQSFVEAFASKPKVVVCPKSGHFPTATEHGIVIEELKRFLDGVR
jgi:pimeloyl-ACP methyl ester carboxylesterase